MCGQVHHKNGNVSKMVQDGGTLYRGVVEATKIPIPDDIERSSRLFKLFPLQFFAQRCGN